ncbi:MAG: luciferase family protein [Solirubrobacteraceae bacterium]|jgi:hypothetical protein
MTGGEPGAAERITAAVAAWPGVTTGPHRFGGLEFRLGRRELGHLHGDHVADLPFPRRVRDELIAGGRARAHHVLPDSGWITLRIDEPAGVANAIDLFRLSYERASHAALVAQRPRGTTRSAKS